MKANQVSRYGPHVCFHSIFLVYLQKKLGPQKVQHQTNRSLFTLQHQNVGYPGNGKTYLSSGNMSINGWKPHCVYVYVCVYVFVCVYVYVYVYVYSVCVCVCVCVCVSESVCMCVCQNGKGR